MTHLAIKSSYPLSETGLKAHVLGDKHKLTVEYEYIRPHNVEAYTRLEKAQKEFKRLNGHMTEFKNRYEIDDDTNKLKNDIFKEYLKNINTELYNEVIEEWNRDEKEPSEQLLLLKAQDLTHQDLIKPNQ